MILSMLHRMYHHLRPVREKGKGNSISIKSKHHGSLHVVVTGNNNKIVINHDVYMLNVDIEVSGNNNNVFIAEKCRLYNLKLRIHGDDNVFSIYDNAGIRQAFILIKEGKKVIIGPDSMLSYGIHIRTSDSHKIIDLSDGHRINNAKNVVVGKHVWISQNVALLKGANIGDYSVVGYGAVCSRAYPAHCIIAGVPGRVIKRDINWDRSLE